MTRAETTRSIKVEIVVVLLITFALQGAGSILSLIEAANQPGTLSDQKVAINVPQSNLGIIDLLRQLLSITRLFAWGALGAYLLWRSGFDFGRLKPRRDVLHGLGFAALIGIPGLGLYLIANALGFNTTVLPSTIDDYWWRPVTLILSAIANAFAEEVVVVAYLITRLRAIGWSENRSLAASALLRGSYHLYQGLGGGLGNVVMGLIFGKFFQKTNRLWPLVIAHAVIDVVAFVGFSLLRGHVSWLPG